MVYYDPSRYCGENPGTFAGDGGETNIPTKDALNAALQEWVRMEKALGTKTQASKFNTATIVYDTNTGK